MLLLLIVVKVSDEISYYYKQNIYTTKMEKEHKIGDKMMSYFVEKDLMKGFKDIFVEEAREDDKFQRKLYTLSGENQFDEEQMKKIIAGDNDLLSPNVKEKIFKRFQDHLAQCKQ